MKKIVISDFFELWYNFELDGSVLTGLKETVTILGGEQRNGERYRS